MRNLCLIVARYCREKYVSRTECKRTHTYDFWFEIIHVGDSPRSVLVAKDEARAQPIRPDGH